MLEVSQSILLQTNTICQRELPCLLLEAAMRIWRVSARYIANRSAIMSERITKLPNVQRSRSVTEPITAAPVGALKIKDAARYLGGISQISVRRLIDRGLITPNRTLRHLLIPISELDRFLAGESK